jgi:hypothetical protein
MEMEMEMALAADARQEGERQQRLHQTFESLDI